MSTKLSIGVIGAGPGGLALGILLKRAGFHDFTIFDREDDVGGTWRINTYPGLACDVKSHLYSYSFDLNPHWSRLWSGQPEILAYFQRCADRYGLRPHLRLRTEIGSAQWDSETQRWCLTTATGDQHHFNAVVSAVGLFTRPLLPELVEQEPFTGTVMHSSRWDHSVSLHGARIAVLGTGSTASQLVPELAKVAAQVYSVQRSPTWILPKPDRHYTRRERWAFAHVPFVKKLYRTRLWLRSESNISVIEHGSDKTQEFTAISLGMLEKTVVDEELRRRLTPDHPMGCKRLVFSSDYLPALTRPNVEVVSSPARYLRARSLVTEDGTERDVDIVVCATGYAAADYLGQLDVAGEHGRTLRETWGDGAHAYLGMAVPAFPNFFMLYGPNTNVGSNSVIFMLEAQARYIVRALKYMRRKGKRYIAVRPAALAEFVAKIDRWMVGTVWTTQCSNYFRAANGRVVTQWPRSARTFWGMTRRFTPADFSFASHPAPTASAVDGDALTALDGAESMTELDGFARLDPALRAVASTRTEFSPAAIQLMREPFNQRRAVAVEYTVAQGVSIIDGSVAAESHRVPVRIYRGGQPPAPAVVYCHAGGFALGNLDTDHRQCVELARRGSCTVVSVDYRLAPEHPYPAALDDAVTVLRWVAANAAELGVDATRLAVAGSSAGGALAACLAQGAADASLPAVKFQLLHQPVLDDRATASKSEFRTSPAFDGEAADLMWGHYLGAQAGSAGAVPARRHRVDGLPPALITCAEIDPFRDEAIDYALRLLGAGVSAELHVFAHTCHGFDSLLPDWPVSERLFAMQGHALSNAFGA